MRRFSRFRASDEPWFVLLSQNRLAWVPVVVRFHDDHPGETLLFRFIASRLAAY